MKLLSLCISVIILVSCSVSEEDCICPAEYAPVCGSDGVEYSNSCFAECAGVNYMSSPCPIMTDALVLDLGPIELDGCGWVIHFNDKNHRPDSILDDFLEDSLEVEIKYLTTSDSSICGFAPFIEVIDIVEMKRK